MTPQLPRLVSLAGLFLAGGVVVGRLEAVVLGAALLAVLIAGLVRRAPSVSVALLVSARRVVEGDPVEVVVRVCSDRRVDQLSVEFALPPELAVVQGSARATTWVPAGESVDVGVTVVPRRWGVHTVGPTTVSWYGRGRLHAWSYVEPEVTLRVVPRADRFTATAVQPFQRALVGSHVSRAAGEGIEYAGIREFRPGDPLRRVNWRVTARYGGLHVTQHRPERNAELVLFIDTFVDVGPPGRTSLDVAVRAALGIATYYLAQMDRVGVVGFGGVVRWLTAGSSRAQLYRITEHLLGVETVLTHADKAVTLLPRTVLPPGALVVGLSPLLDDRASAALVAISRRGHGVLVVDTAPARIFPDPDRREVLLAQRLFLLERDSLIARMGEAGVPVVPWAGTGSLDAVLGELSRLHARPKVVRR
jgi:uncharacterized protein (DUF58 family)